MIYSLKNTIRNYAWGAFDGIARFLGRTDIATKPEAELWIGAHPDSPSRVLVDSSEIPLNELVAKDPVGMLGESVCKRFGGSFPYLLKVLAAGSPLSIQAHPTIEQAQAGFDDEERRQIPQNAPYRNYRDRNHKPELIYAITPFEAFCGFRPACEIMETFERIGQPGHLELATILRAQPDARGLQTVLERLLVAPVSVQKELIEQTIAAAEQNQPDDPDQHHLRWIATLGRIYPGDIGIVTALLLNYVALDVGQAMFLPAQSLHSYLKGVGIEIMASSDNVLRGGLTPKHVDVSELLHVLSFEPMAAPIVKPTAISTQEQAFITPAADFRLSSINVNGTLRLSPFGPEILLCADGKVSVSTEGHSSLTLARGESVFIAANTSLLHLEGKANLFRATVGTL